MPRLDPAEKEMLESELKKQKALQSVAHLEGVKLLTEEVRAKVFNCVELLSNSYFDKSEHELRALCATLRANLDLYQTIKGSKKSIDAIESVLVPEEPSESKVEKPAK